MKRRQFLKTSGIASVSFLLALRGLYGANEKIIAGLMGAGGRGSFLANAFAKRKDVEIGWICDPDTRRLGNLQKQIENTQGRKPQVGQDFRKILDDKSVDVLINATPDHWHALGTILACIAGKDVYVEKPLSHNLWEGRMMVEAARKYKRVVQVGTQSRSAPYVHLAKERIQSGKLGKIHTIKVYNMISHPFIKSRSESPPKEVNFDLWSGPAKILDYGIARNWLNYFEYSCGPIPGDAIHQLDLARMVLGDPLPPKKISQVGEILVLKDGRDTPDTQFATFEFEDFVMTLESALWTPYMKKTPYEIRDTDVIPDWKFNGTRIEIYGTNGFMFLGRHGDGWQIFDENGKLGETKPGRQGDNEHIENFISCVRSRQKPIADVEQGHLSTMLCHLANISFKLGNQSLQFDPAKELIKDNSEANKLLKRSSYRKPWEIPAIS